ncbi:MAG: hypothetical protein JJU34_12195 [Lunatimonas sp.]|uniref:hypothetical protein n=1 Tax=Lunatimonas sp. TaxID=2060141 RepID=UPI00263B604D|nr:hypothetical protein [Lunatimonas sp.]MCC5938033.1 hypothetical protein [Lunatimonas sp.]
MNLYRLVVGIFLIGIQLSCGEEDELIACNAFPTVDNALYVQLGNDVQVTQASMLSGCLEIRYSYQGCDGNREAALVFDDRVAESFPPTRWARLYMEEAGDCAQTHSRTLRVDLTLIQVADLNSVQIVLEGWPDPIVYRY